MQQSKSTRPKGRVILKIFVSEYHVYYYQLTTVFHFYFIINLIEKANTSSLFLNIQTLFHIPILLNHIYLLGSSIFVTFLIIIHYK